MTPNTSGATQRNDPHDNLDCAHARQAVPVSVGIQPHGFLVCLNESSHVIQASENVKGLARRPLEQLLGAPLADLIGAEAAKRITESIGLEVPDGTPFYVGAITDPRDRGAAGEGPLPPLAAVVHKQAGALIVELEPMLAKTDAFASIYPLVRTFVASLRSVDAVEELAALAVRDVRRITGFGRALVCRFDGDGHGHVIAEDCADGYAPYFNQRFPASHLPGRARERYLRNPVRLVADANQPFAGLVPPLHPASDAPTDLAYASLRGISAAQSDYMKRMGWLASLSIALVVHGRLWGLICCHHATPHLPPFEIRTACAHLGQILSLQIEAKEVHAETVYRLDLRRPLSQLLASLAQHDNLLAGLAAAPDDLLHITGSNGAVVVFEGSVARIGTTPDEATVLALVDWLAASAPDVYSTDALGDACKAVDVDSSCAGLLAVSISKVFRNYVIWFRPEAIRTIEWASDPRARGAADGSGVVRPGAQGPSEAFAVVAPETGVPGADGAEPGAAPRESLAIRRERVSGRSTPWRTSESEIAVEFRTALLGIVLKRAEEMAQLAFDLGRANKELEAFSYSVSHDLRAPLRHIVGYGDLLSEYEAANLSERGNRFLKNIVDSARFAGTLVDDLLTFSQMGRAALRPAPVDMRELVDAAIHDQRADTQGRDIVWQVGELPVVPGDAAFLQLAVHNLVSNAIKYTRTREHAVIEIGSYPGAGEFARQQVFFVRDNGVGFNMKYVAKLFGVFQRLHRFEDFEGTGIGLANVRRIVDRHDGRTWAEGKQDAGATFYFSLPQMSQDAKRQRDSMAVGTPAQLASELPAARPGGWTGK